VDGVAVTFAVYGSLSGLIRLAVVFQRASKDVTLHLNIKLGRVSVLAAIYAFS